MASLSCPPGRIPSIQAPCGRGGLLFNGKFSSACLHLGKEGSFDLETAFLGGLQVVTNVGLTGLSQTRLPLGGFSSSWHHRGCAFD